MFFCYNTFYLLHTKNRDLEREQSKRVCDATDPVSQLLRQQLRLTVSILCADCCLIGECAFCKAATSKIRKPGQTRSRTRRSSVSSTSSGESDAASWAMTSMDLQAHEQEARTPLRLRRVEKPQEAEEWEVDCVQQLTALAEGLAGKVGAHPRRARRRRHKRLGRVRAMAHEDVCGDPKVWTLRYVMSS